MQYRKLTETGDYAFGSGKLNFINDLDAIAQAVKTKLLLFYGEWWEDTTIGIPMFESIVGQVNSKNIATALKELVKKRLQDIPEITETKDLEVEIQGRSITLSLTAIVAGEEITVEVANV